MLVYVYVSSDKGEHLWDKLHAPWPSCLSLCTVLLLLLAYTTAKKKHPN